MHAPEFLPATDLTELIAAISLKNHADALPSKLSYKWLLQVTRDLRILADGDVSDADSTRNMSGPMFLLGIILCGRHLAVSAGDGVNVLIEDLMESFRRYQHVAEREIVSRQIGGPSLDLEEAFLEYLDTMVRESAH